jgi:hypothetical protein
VPKAVSYFKDTDRQGWYLTDTTKVDVATRGSSDIDFDTDPELIFIADGGMAVQWKEDIRKLTTDGCIFNSTTSY